MTLVYEQETAKELTAFLVAHAEVVAERAIGRLGGPLSAENIDRFLRDEECLRYSTEIRYTSEGVTPHQFAQPFFDEREGETHCVLNVRPEFEGRSECLPPFVAYMAAVINYGEMASPELCERYGSALMRMDVQSYYETICALFDAAHVS